MSRQQPYDYDQYPEIPMPQQGNSQQPYYQSNKQQGNKGQKHQQNPQQQGKPNFQPPPVRATEKDPLYQLVSRFQWDMEHIYYVPSMTYFVQGRGVVDARAGLRRSQTKGYALYDADGSLLFVHESDPDYAYIHEKVEDWWGTLQHLDRIAQEYATPSNRRRNIRNARKGTGTNPKQLTTSATLAWWLKWGMLAMLVLTVIIFFATRG